MTFHFLQTALFRISLNGANTYAIIDGLQDSISKNAAVKGRQKTNKMVDINKKHFFQSQVIFRYKSLRSMKYVKKNGDGQFWNWCHLVKSTLNQLNLFCKEYYEKASLALLSEKRLTPNEKTANFQDHISTGKISPKSSLNDIRCMIWITCNH